MPWQKGGSVPYLDFAVWGPHGYRPMRQLRMTGLIFAKNGELQNVELKGPPTLDAWDGCYALLRA
eukprot:6093809-Lingulodinium_polyedra.AAC.1